MKISVVLLFLFFPIFLTLSSAVPSSSSPSVNNSTCPVDLNYVLRLPWNSSACQNFHPSDSVDDTRRSDC
ncbi:hypothetical protein QN277_002531 [Acacia crassicarpa]|nr:hypothetical protein QN277_002531 [Acacia crassicarpa]